ncbi:MAG TPA: hypothetical protein VGG92_11525 [Caulobacteraceae bacterium]
MRSDANHAATVGREVNYGRTLDRRGQRTEPQEAFGRVGDRLQAERQALNILQQGVVQFREGALPFGDAMIHQHLQLFLVSAQAMLDEQPERREDDEADEGRLEECASVLHVRIL